MKNAPEMQEITPEYVMQLGKELIDAVLEATPADEVRKHFTAKELLAGFDLKDRLAGLDPKEILAGFDLKDRLAGLTPDEIRRYLEQLEKSNPQ